MSDLTVLTVVENDPGLLDLMLKSLEKFTDPLPCVLICDNTNGKNYDRIQDIDTDLNVRVFSNSPSLSGGSNRHSDGLNMLFKQVDTKYTAIVESDVIVLRDDWYKIDHSKSFRIKAAPKGEHIYHVCFMVFETDVLRGMDFRPGKDGNRGNRSYKSSEDVGWRICNYINHNDVEKLDFVDCKTGQGKLFGSEFQSDEFWHNGSPIIAHLGRGSNISGKSVRKGFKHPKDQLTEWKKKAEEILR